MFRTHASILGDLDPHNPASIQALIDFHRATFGGAHMVDDSGTGDDKATDDKATDEQKSAAAVDKKTEDKPLGPNGEKALQAERDSRKALEQQLQQLQTAQKEQTDRLAAAFGIKDKDAKSGTDDVVAALQKQMAEMQHTSLVYQIAGQHQITETDDLELLRSTSNEATMRKLATRLAVKSDDASDGKPGRPKPDASQGKGGAGGSARSVAEAQADYIASRQKKQ